MARFTTFTLTRLPSIVWVSLALFVSALAHSQTGESAFGPRRDVGVVANFGPDAATRWQSRSGQNVSWQVKSGYSIPGVATNLMRVDLSVRDAEIKDAAQNWFASDLNDVPIGRFSPKSEGLHITLGSLTSVQWWVNLNLTLADGTLYANVIADQPFPPGRMVDFHVPYERFKSKSGQSLTSTLADSIRRIGFELGGASVVPKTFLLQQIATYDRQRFSSWTKFSTSHDSNNLFYRDEPVSIQFSLGGTPSPNAIGLAYDIRNYSGTVVRTGIVPLGPGGSNPLSLTLGKMIDGYYEVTAYYADRLGKRISEQSCILAEGSLPPGLGTFAILPCTHEETIQRRKAVGQTAFFGLHGDYLEVAEHLGVSWRLEYSDWKYREPVQPDRSKGDAPWVTQLLSQPANPAYAFNFQPFDFNLRVSLPDWAMGSATSAPAFKSWDDALSLVRDQVRVNRYLFPHMSPRVYGGAWEVNLNMQPFVSQPPEYKAEDVVELYRRVREVVKAEDPDALVAGPNPSTLDLAWYERIFKAGALKYLDAIETHAYDDGVFSSEENQTDLKLAGLRALVSKYNGNRSLPIYVTERGVPGVLGSKMNYREQAELMTRSCIILKGEGVKVFLPFYGTDYDAAAFGFSFNLEMEGPGRPWATKRISPKPMVNAVATCVRQLEGAAPTERIRSFGPDVWAYSFLRGTEKTLVIWTTGSSRTVSVPASGALVQGVSMMGVTSSIPCLSGHAAIEIGSAPVYLHTSGR